MVTGAAVDKVPSLPLAWYVKESVPTKLAAGVYVNEPSALRLRMPCAGPEASTAVTGWPLADTLLASTPVAGTLSLPLSSTV